MTLNKLIEICNQYYDDGYLSLYWNAKKSKPVDTHSGDTLALFIVREIADTYQAGKSNSYQLIEAQRCMRSAQRQLVTMIESLEFEISKAFDHNNVAKSHRRCKHDSVRRSRV